jgi:hypothetical protein
MFLVWILFGIIFVAFGLVVFRGAPYIPTFRRDADSAIDMAGVKKGECIVDLGSGDGRLLIAAAKKGIPSVGYEINPFLVIFTRYRTRKYKDLVTIKTADFWRVKLPQNTGAVYVFLADMYMVKLGRFLHKEAARLHKPITLISYGFDLPGHKVTARERGLVKYIINP